MATETTKALHAALATREFAGVRAALEHEAGDAIAASWNSDRAVSPQEFWRNDRWQAAWREMLRNNDAYLSCFVDTRGEVCNPSLRWFAQGDFAFRAEWFDVMKGGVCGESLTGDKLADALRDFALGETR